MISNRAIAHLRQLCYLGTPSEALAPALLESLHYVVPGLHHRLCWCDEQQRMTAYFCEAPEMYVYGKLFIEQFDNRLEDFPGTSFVMSQRPGVGHYLPLVSTKAYFNGVYYNEIERPVNGHHFLDMVIGDSRGNLGTILLTREKIAKPYSTPEIRALESLIPHLAHAFRTRSEGFLAADGERDSAVIMVDERGTIQHASSKAQQWLSMAFHPVARSGPVSAKLSATLPDALKSMCRNLHSLSQGLSADRPLHTVHNAWGRFTFTAQLLLSDTRIPSEGAAIIIDHTEPRIAMLMRKMWSAGLSTGQKQVCLQLTSDRHEAAIAKHLNVSRSTVRDYVKKIYNKFDVHHREALMRKLLQHEPGLGRYDA